eukprot:TRINITY_DN9635_c0_g3_i6.p1 TRINITY_DN9635_c0_g3~~TRINITY_DN9635_c0_g3_i6.p1  ORF type:complete len:278 (-),score=44.69 TRINITY_DN9635_c0_g3_i6:600-1433(-)
MRIYRALPVLLHTRLCLKAVHLILCGGKSECDDSMTAGIRNSIYERKNTPGPGAYNVKKSSHSPEYKFGQYIPTSYESDIPGPGTYKPNLDFAYRPISKKITFGVGERTNFANSRAPGPGAYEDSSKSTCPRITTVKIASSSRNDTLNPYKTVGPGPAAYSVGVRVHLNGCRFSRAKRKGIYVDTVSPGPGAYPVKELLGKGSAKPLILSRRPDTTPHYGMFSPGPAKYIVGAKTCSKSFSIGRSYRDDVFSGNKVPDPLKYSPNYKANRSTSPSWR